MNAREAAYTALLRHENNASSSNIELDATIKKYNLEGVERAFCTALFYGVIERAITLDYYISLLSDREDIDTNVRVILRMGLYQIIYMDKVPDSAAVNESVSLARRFWARKNSEGFINAILRSYLREKDKLLLPNKKKDPIKHISVKYSMPEWLCAMFCKNYGADTAEKIFDEFNKVPALTLRVNTLKTTRESLMERLWAAGIKAKPTKNAPNGVLLAGGTPYSALEAFEGEFFVQNEASQICVQALGARDGEKILDACACPGGKSFGMAIDMNNSGEIHSCDLHKNKLSLIERGAESLGISIITTMERNAAKEDARGVLYDRILCDVPCSGLGVIAQKPDIKRKKPEDIERLPKVQANILRESAKHLKSGGVLVYSTCTLNPAENADVVNTFLAENKEFFLVPFEVGGIKANGMIELFPHIHRTNGFFIAKMKKI